MSMTDKQRAAVVNETKTWLGTPYKGWSCLKGHGVDCGQLLYGVYHAAGLIPVLKLPRDYSLQVSLHRASTEYVDLVATYFSEITEAEVKPGDIVVYQLGLAYAHAAIVVEWPNYVIHAVGRHGVSGAHGVKTPIFHKYRQHKKRFFTLKDAYCLEVLSVRHI